MTEVQVHDILKRIAAVYPRFEITEMVVEVWTDQLSGMDYDHVLYNLKKYIQSEKWPPTIADIAAFPRKRDKTLEKIEKWQEEALTKTDPKKAKEYMRKWREDFLNAQKHRS